MHDSLQGKSTGGLEQRLTEDLEETLRGGAEKTVESESGVLAVEVISAAIVKLDTGVVDE